MSKRLVTALAAGAAAAVLAGCFDVEQAVSLKRDLSGTASFRMTVDFEPMIAIMAGMAHSMSGQPGEATPAEIEQARRDFLDKQKNTPSAGGKQDEQAEERAKLEKSLPPGVKLLSSGIEQQGTKILVRFAVGFDDMRKLQQIKVPGKGDTPGPAGQNPYEDPFSSLRVVDEGPTLLVTLGSSNPAARMQEQMGQGGGGPAASPEMTKAMEAAFKSARFVFRLESPFDVVETNATRREGRTLVWEIRPTESGAPQLLSARLKKG